MAKTELFKENIFQYGTKSKSDKVNFTFELNGGVSWDQIEYTYPDCGGCTTYTVNEKERTITGTLDLSKAVHASLPKGNNQLTKTVFVKVKNGQSPFIEDPNPVNFKKRLSNKENRLERLQIVGVVTI